jgi:hypothetical protein
VRETESLRSDFHYLNGVATAVGCGHPIQGLSDLIFDFKKDRQITHNSMFADYLPSTNSSIGIRDQTIKDPHFSPVQGNTRPSSLIRPRSACLKPGEEHQPTQGVVRFRGIHNVRHLGNSSIKNLADFWPNLASARATGANATPAWIGRAHHSLSSQLF